MSVPLAIVTGAAGFIGRHCGRELASKGFAVAGLDRFSVPDAARWGFSRWREGGVTRKNLGELLESGETPETIIHCAGSGSVAESFADPDMDFTANVVTTEQALEFAREIGCKAFVLPSSAAVYGQAGDIPIRECAPLAPVSPYGAHKRMAEMLCASYGAAFGVPTVCVRLFSIYGQGLRKQLLWDACKKAAGGEFAFFGTGDELRDWLHVSDAARLLALAADHASPDCRIVNGGTGKGTPTKEILARLGRAWSPGLSPVFSGDARRGDPTDYLADVSRIAGWGFLPASDLDAGLTGYVEWFKSEMT